MDESANNSITLTQGNVASIVVENCRAKYITATIIVEIPWLRLTRLKVQTSANTESEERFLYNMPEMPAQVVKRPELIDKIEKGFLEKPNRPIVVCYGMRGVGKSILGIDYILQKSDDYQHIFVFTQVSQESLTNAFRDLARNMALIKQDDHTTDFVSLLKGWMEHQRNCLLFFDDVFEFDTIKSFIPNRNVKVVIASPHAFTGFSNVLVDVFTPDHVALLNGDQELAASVGYLPRAIIEGVHAVFSFWRKDLAALEQQSPNALCVLKKIAEHDKTILDRKLLHQSLKETHNDFELDVFNDALRLLMRYSMVVTDTSLRNILIHVLFKRFLAEQFDSSRVLKLN